MSATVTLRKLSEGLWKHEPNDRQFFFNGQYYAIITQTTFYVYSLTGRLATFCPISGVTVIDGGSTYNTADYTSLAVHLFDKKYPGIYIAIGSGGGGSATDFVVYERVVNAMEAVVESGLSDIVVLNRNAPQDPVTFTYLGGTITFTSGVANGDAVLIFAKKSV